MRRFLALFLIGFLLLGAVPAGAADTEEPAFSDVSPEEWYAFGIGDAERRGLMIGVGDGLFAPDTELSRAMAVTVLWRLAGEPEGPEKSGFADVPEDTWYTAAAAWAEEQGIARGYGDGLFGPNDPVLREQLAVLLYRYARCRGFDVSFDGPGFEVSEDDDANWGLNAMAWAAYHMFFNHKQVRLDYGGMMGSGSTGYSRCPGDAALRGETAVFLSRFCRVYLDGEGEEARVLYRPVSDQGYRGGYVWDFMTMELPETWQGNYVMHTAAYDGVLESVSFSFTDCSNHVSRTSGGYLFTLVLYPEGKDSSQFGSWETLGDAGPGKSGRVCTVDAGPVMGRLCLYADLPQEGSEYLLGELYNPEQPGSYLVMRDAIPDILSSVRFDGGVKVVDVAPGFDIPLG